MDEVQRQEVDGLQDEVRDLKLRCGRYEELIEEIVDYILQTASEEHRSILGLPNHGHGETYSLLVGMKVDRAQLSIARAIRGG